MVDTRIIYYLVDSVTRILSAVNGQLTTTELQLTGRPRQGLSSSCFEGQYVGIGVVGEPYRSELMGD